MLISKENLKQNVSLAWPLAMNSVLMQSMVLIDLLLVAPLGEVSIAALGISSAIVSLLLGIQNSLGNGTQMIIARATGAGETKKISTDLMSGLSVNIGFSILAFLFLWFGSAPLLALVTDNPLIAEQTMRYLHIAMFSILVSSLTQVIIVYFNASRQTRIPMYGFMIEIPCNFLISWLLVHGLFGAPELGLQGAAVGSLIAVFIRLVYLLIKVRREKTLDLPSGYRHMTKQTVWAHIVEVSPIAANFLVLMGGMTLYQMLFAQLSVYDYAAITLIYPWMRIGTQFVNAWAQASAITVSQHIGRNTLTEIPEFIRQAVNITQILAVVVALMFLVFSFIVPYIYPNIEVETMRALALIAPIYIATPLVRTYNTICGHTLRAMGDAYKVLRVHVVTQWVIALPLCVLFIYLGLPVYWVFGVTLLEECLKVINFRAIKTRRLKGYQALSS